jgi:hypothetical protein
MQRAAIGIRMHSGWGVLIAVSESRAIVDRRRIEVIADDLHARHRGNQPYHRAAELGGAAAEQFIAEYTAASDLVAHKILSRTVAELNARGYEVAAGGLLLASGRKLPPLLQILASHPLIHTAEGELFRQIIRRACESLRIPVFPLVERELDNYAGNILGESFGSVRGELAKAGKSLGAPWTADHKAAALAAVLALASLSS